MDSITNLKGANKRCYLELVKSIQRICNTQLFTKDNPEEFIKMVQERLEKIKQLND